MLPWIHVSWYCWYWYIVLPVRLVFVYCRYTWYYNWYIILLVLLYCWYIVLPGIPGIAAGISYCWYCWCWYIACKLSCRYCLVYLVLLVLPAYLVLQLVYHIAGVGILLVYCLAGIAWYTWYCRCDTL